MKYKHVTAELALLRKKLFGQNYVVRKPEKKREQPRCEI